MKTVQCEISTTNGIEILTEIDEQNLPLSLVIPANGVSSVSVRFELWIDGASTAHDIVLHRNGTWKFLTQVEA